MRICYIGDAGSIHIQRWVKYFADRGHEVSLISPRPFSGDPQKNVHLHVLRLIGRIRGLNIFLSAVQISRIVRKLRPDLIHAHHVTSCGFWAALCRLRPHVLTAWGSDIVIQPQKSRLVRWKATYALKHADLITCDAEHMVDRIADFGIDREKIKIINFGVDTTKFAAAPTDGNLREELLLPAGSLVVISLRSLFSVYDLESLIKAAPLVLAKVPRARFVIVGDGDQRAYLESVAKHLGVGEQIKFVGAITSSQTPRYLAAADVYVSTSLSDAGLAASTAEAMACELPVVITDFGDNGKWVKDGKGGFLVPLRNPVLLAERLILLLTDENLRREFGRLNRNVITERNDYHKEMSKVEQLYRNLDDTAKSKTLVANTG